MLNSRPGRDQSDAALILIDIQPDFLPGGALAVAEGDAILPGVKELMLSGGFPIMAATQDWHPEDHISFAGSHEGKEPFDVIQCHGHDQVLWPAHCVQGTPGARLHPQLPWDEVDIILRKGRSADSDSYSGFRNNWNPDSLRPPTGLDGYLKERGVESLYLCGLARDVCVLWTALDAAAAGYETYFIWDLTRAVDPDSDDATRETLRSNGIHITLSESISE